MEPRCKHSPSKQTVNKRLQNWKMLTHLLFHFCLQSNSVSWASLPHCSEEDGKSHSAASYQGSLFLCTSLCLTVSPESETGFHILHPNPSTAPHTLVVFNQFLSKEKRNSPAAGSVSAMQGSTGSSLERLPRTGISVDFPASVLRCFSCVRLYKTSWTAALQAPLSKGFSRQEYRSGLPCPPPRDLPDTGIEPMSLTSNLQWQAGSLGLAPPGKPSSLLTCIKSPQLHVQNVYSWALDLLNQDFSGCHLGISIFSNIYFCLHVCLNTHKIHHCHHF